MYEAVHAQNENVSEKTIIPPPDWEALIEQIASDVVTEHTPAQILKVRGKMYDLLVHCIPPTIILKVRLLLSFHAFLNEVANLAIRH